MQVGRTPGLLSEWQKKFTAIKFLSDIKTLPVFGKSINGVDERGQNFIVKTNPLQSTIVDSFPEGDAFCLTDNYICGYALMFRLRLTAPLNMTKGSRGRRHDVTIFNKQQLLDKIYRGLFRMSRCVYYRSRMTGDS